MECSFLARCCKINQTTHEWGSISQDWRYPWTELFSVSGEVAWATGGAVFPLGSTENGYSIARSLITYIRHRHKVCFSFDSCALRNTFVLWFLYTLLWFRNCYCALYALVIFFNLMSDNGAVCTHLFKPLWYIYIFLIQGDDWNSGVTAVSRNAAFMILLLVLNKPGCREALERGGTC